MIIKLMKMKRYVGRRNYYPRISLKINSIDLKIKLLSFVLIVLTYFSCGLSGWLYREIIVMNNATFQNMDMAASRIAYVQRHVAIL